MIDMHKTLLEGLPGSTLTEKLDKMSPEGQKVFLAQMQKVQASQTSLVVKSTGLNFGSTVVKAWSLSMLASTLHHTLGAAHLSSLVPQVEKK